MATDPTAPDPLVPFDRVAFDQLMRARAVSAYELARRTGVTPPAIYALLRERPARGKATQRVRLSTARALAGALGAAYDESAGTLTIPVRALVARDGNPVWRQEPTPVSAAIVDADAEKLREALGAEAGAGVALRWLVNLQMWTEQPAGAAVPIEAQGRMGRALLEIAALVRSYGTDGTRDLLRQALIALGKELGEEIAKRASPVSYDTRPQEPPAADDATRDAAVRSR